MKVSWMKGLVSVCLMLLWATSTHAQNYTEGKNYTQLSKAVITESGNKIEVLEFFWYGCPHCYQFEPTISKWKKNKPSNVHFTRIPAPLNPSWMPHTKAYYALEIMGKGEQYHEALFKAIHVERKKLFDMTSITQFLVSKGVDEKAFTSNVNSFAVEMRARKAMQLSREYKLNGVPMMAVNGKYTISAQQAGGYKQMIEITNYLAKKEK
jgi:protein dithiol oxidoreductase (disulfide-forming)